MRLPASSPQHARQEDARELHERLWDAYQAEGAGTCNGRVFIPSLPGQSGKDLIRVTNNLHRFWQARGFRLHARQLPDRSGFEMWVEPMRAEQP